MSVEFLKHVCPQQGYIHIQGLGHNATPPLRNTFKNFREAHSAYEYAVQLSEAGYDTYFSTASLNKENDKKELKNYNSSRVVQFDIDIDPTGKSSFKYSSIKDAKKALVDFISENELSTPTLVSSGYGIHGYFTFTRDISLNEKVLASKLFIKLSQSFLFRLDVGVVSNAVTLLRVPNTNNYKNNQTKPVKLVCLSEPLVYEEFVELLQAKTKIRAESFLDQPAPDAGGVISINKIILEASYSDWNALLDKSDKTSIVKTKYLDPETNKSSPIEIAQSKGCEIIRRANLDHEHTSEYVWKGVLGVIYFCRGTDEEKEKWAIAISNRHSNFSEEETINKLHYRGKATGPTLCSYFRASDMGDACVNCPHSSGDRPISTPIQLAKVYDQAEPEDNIINTHAKDIGSDITITIPDEYPPGYFRSKAGGVIFRGKVDNKKHTVSEEEEDMQDTIIYPYDFWLHKRILNADNDFSDGGGSIGIWRHLTPNEGLVEMNIPAANLAKKETLLQQLQANGVHVVGRKSELIINYMNAFLAFDQARTTQQKARSRFGWHDNYSRFLIGRREVDDKGEMEMAPICANVAEIHKHYGSKGTLEEWKKVINTYNNPGNEVRAFSLFLGFGCPLYVFLNVGSSFVHLSNAMSGVGKSTIQMCINSIYGHPVGGMLSLNDTILSIQNRMASLSHLPACLDEVTNIDAEKLSNFVFNFSQNRERNRMQAARNIERSNNATWATVCFTSGNSSLLDKLKVYKSVAQGEQARIMEFIVDRDTNLTTDEATRLFHDVLPENYGIAGEILMKYIVANRAHIEHLLKEKRAYIQQKSGLTNENRFHYSLLTAAFMGAEIAKDLGLHDIDIQRVENTIIGLVSNTKIEVDETHEEEVATESVMGNILSRLAGNLIVVDGDDKQTGGLVSRGFHRLPNGEVKGRYEKKTGIVALIFRSWTEFCANERIPMQDVTRKLKEQGLFIGKQPYDLSEGTPLPPMRTQCLVFKHPNASDIMAQIPLTP